MKRAFKSVLVSVLFSALVFAGGFKDLGNGVRAFSLGLSYIAIADNPYAIFYNPAGIGQIKRLSFATTYSNLYPFVQDDKLYFLNISAVVPVFSIFDFGVGVNFFKSGMWNENQLVFSVAREFKYIKGLMLGGSVRFLRWSAVAPEGESGYSYFNFTFDAGMIFVLRDIFSGSDLRFGFSAKNITQPSIAVNKSPDAKLPLEINGGIVFVSRNYNYLVGFGARKASEDLKLDIGFEITAFSEQVVKNNFEFVLRASGGISAAGNRQSNLCAGFGVKYWKFKIDYVFVHQLEIPDSGGSHKIGVEYSF